MAKPPEQTEAKRFFGSLAVLLGPMALRPCIAAGLPFSERTSRFGISDKSSFTVSKQLSGLQSKLTRGRIARQRQVSEINDQLLIRNFCHHVPQAGPTRFFCEMPERFAGKHGQVKIVRSANARAKAVQDEAYREPPLLLTTWLCLNMFQQITNFRSQESCRRLTWFIKGIPPQHGVAALAGDLNRFV